MRRLLKFVDNLFVPLSPVFVYYFSALFVSGFFSTTAIRATVVANIIVVSVYIVAKFCKNSLIKRERSKLTNMDAVIGVGLLLLVWFSGQIAGTVIQHFGDVAYAQYQSRIAQDSEFAVLLLFFTAPFAEEILMRGVLYKGWRNGFGPWFALVASSLLFALMHGTPSHAIPTFLMGMLAAIVYERTHSLLYPIGFHLAYNLMAIVFGGLNVPDVFFMPQIAFGGVFLCLLLLLVTFWNLTGRRLNDKTRERL